MFVKRKLKGSHLLYLFNKCIEEHNTLGVKEWWTQDELIDICKEVLPFYETFLGMNDFIKDKHAQALLALEKSGIRRVKACEKDCEVSHAKKD